MYSYVGLDILPVYTLTHSLTYLHAWRKFVKCNRNALIQNLLHLHELVIGICIAPDGVLFWISLLLLLVMLLPRRQQSYLSCLFLSLSCLFLFLSSFAWRSASLSSAVVTTVSAATRAKRLHLSQQGAKGLHGPQQQGHGQEGAPGGQVHPQDFITPPPKWLIVAWISAVWITRTHTRAHTHTHTHKRRPRR